MTFQMECNCGCGSSVTATDAGFSTTTVEVAACSSLKAQGIASQNIRKSVAFAAAVSESPIRHREGLVTFA